MRVGLVIPKYGFNSVTRRAIRLAEAARQFAEVNIYAEEGALPPRVDRSLDDQVVRSSVVDFHNWAKSRTHVCWLSSPTNRRLSQVGPDTVKLLLLDWHVHAADAARVLPAVDRIVAPSQAAYRFVLDKFSDKDVRYLHWSPGLPLISRHLEPKPRVALVLPAHGDAGACLELVRKLLDQFSLVSMDVLYFRADVTDSVLARFRGLERLWGSVLNLAPVSRLDRYSLAALFARANLAIFPSVAATTAMTAQMALACGTPIVCYDIAPYNEYVRPGVDGFLVPCQSRQNSLGAPRAVADYTALHKVSATALRGWPCVGSPVCAEYINGPLQFVEQWSDILHN